MPLVWTCVVAAAGYVGVLASLLELPSPPPPILVVALTPFLFSSLVLWVVTADVAARAAWRWLWRGRGTDRP